MPDMVFTNLVKKGQKFMKKKNLAFTLAEVLIVIGIIGVVAALTLPNLNHATGDKETVTRLQKAYSILSEANDRAVAIYGPISTWNTESCRNADNFQRCYMQRIGEFLKISKYCDETGEEEDSSYSDCSALGKSYMQNSPIIYQLQDAITFTAEGVTPGCDNGYGLFGTNIPACFDYLTVDINGPNKGKNSMGYDVFPFLVSDKLGVSAPVDYDSAEDLADTCIGGDRYYCTYWVLEYGNLDYLKADANTHKCNDSNIILDGTTNTSCH